MVRAIGNDNDSTLQSNAEFTPARATQMLPLVGAIVADMVQLSTAVDARTKQLSEIDDIPGSDRQSYREELIDIHMSVEEDRAKFEKCVEELLALGVYPHEPFDGCVDFPTKLNRQGVSLCWRMGGRNGQLLA